MAAVTQPAPAKTPSLIDRLAQSSHLWIAGAAVVLPLLMIVPIPPWMLDLLLS